MDTDGRAAVGKLLDLGAGLRTMRALAIEQDCWSDY